MLYIRADMNQEIATGHIMRCLSIADAARTMGEDTTFLLADSEAESYLLEKGYRSVVLHTNWRDMESELNMLLSVLSGENVKRLLIDSYYVTENYLRRLRETVETIYLDDLNRFIYPVDALICYAAYWKKFLYKERYPAETKLYLGPRFIPLRQEFSNVPDKIIPKKIRKVLVLSGGTDFYGVAELITQTLNDIGGLEADVICGRFSGAYERLTKCYWGQKWIRIYQSTERISELMKEADLAISAGGFTLYELCACGVPTISYILADNQIDNVNQFLQDGIIECAGDVRTGHIGQNLKRLIEQYDNQAFRMERSGLARSLADGYGAVRIARILMGISS